MGTNGGCQCVKNITPTQRSVLTRALLYYRRRLDEVESEVARWRAVAEYYAPSKSVARRMFVSCAEKPKEGS
jgi:hypothetical protein